MNLRDIHNPTLSDHPHLPTLHFATSLAENIGAGLVPVTRPEWASEEQDCEHDDSEGTQTIHESV